MCLGNCTTETSVTLSRKQGDLLVIMCASTHECVLGGGGLGVG